MRMRTCRKPSAVASGASVNCERVLCTESAAAIRCVGVATGAGPRAKLRK